MITKVLSIATLHACILNPYITNSTLPIEFINLMRNSPLQMNENAIIVVASNPKYSMFITTPL